MVIEEGEHNRNKKAKRPNSIRGAQGLIRPSRTSDGANIQINIQTAIPKLEKTAQKHLGVCNPMVF